MKNLFYIWAAFMMGVSLTIAIQACGEDSFAQEAGGGDNGGGSEEQPKCTCNVSFAYQKPARYVSKDEKGRITSETVFKYDTKGRCTMEESTSYASSLVSQKWYKVGYSRTVFIYSEGDTKRTEYNTTISYDETGAETRNREYTLIRELYVP